MDILKVLQENVASRGLAETAKDLDIPQGLLSQYNSGKKSPGLSTCQKILDMWMADGKSVEEENCTYTIDDDGIVNSSFVPAEWGRKKKLWEGRDVCLCIPTNKPIPEATFFTVLALVMKYRMALRFEHRGGDSMVTRSRNQLAKRFLDTGATWSVWFDSDMVFPIGNAEVYMTLTNMRHVAHKFLSVHVIERLISWNKSVVGGCYWDRRGGGKLIAGGGNIMRPIPHDSLTPIGFVGTGCLAVHRQVFLDIAQKFPETLSKDSLGNECGFFTNIQTPKRMLGEDESFAWRANEAGHPSFLDLGLLCGHVGTENIHGLPLGGSKI